MGEDDHECAWKDRAQQLTSEVEKIQAEIEALKRHIYGKRSEKMPPMDREVKRSRKTDPKKSQQTRRKNAELKAKAIKTETVTVAVPEADRDCPKCGNDELTKINSVKPTTIIDYVPGYFRRRVYQREKLVCSCGKHVVTAPVPDKVFEKTQYGPGFMAYLVTAKILDSMPLYRLENAFKRGRIPMSRSTMTTLFHRVGGALGIVARRILAQIAASDIVLADETTHRTQKNADKKSYVWTFIAGNCVGYCFSAGRGGQTPSAVLGGTKGTLVVDAYTGYNAVTGVDGRERAGCLAHVRRKFFDSLKQAPEAAAPLEMIRQIYLVEHDAAERRITGTAEHQQMREELELPWLDELYIWIAKNKALFPPKSNLGKAMSYAHNNWQTLTRFIKDVRIPPDNNASERALRVVALGRKNFLFVRDQESGENLANLYTVLATCEANGVNPQEYLTDVLLRLDSTPASRVDELLPSNWKPLAR